MYSRHRLYPTYSIPGIAFSGVSFRIVVQGSSDSAVGDLSMLRIVLTIVKRRPSIVETIRRGHSRSLVVTCITLHRLHCGRGAARRA